MKNSWAKECSPGEGEPMSIRATIWTEGKTDWQHLKRSFDALGAGGQIEFKEHTVDFGDENLLKQCAASAREPIIYLQFFYLIEIKGDIVSKVEEPGSRYKQWGNNVYSFALPVPSHRIPENGVCIELTTRTRNFAHRTIMGGVSSFPLNSTLRAADTK